MNQALQDKLFAKYPAIFRDHDKSAQESCMHWGITCDDGWFDILNHLCHALSTLYSTGFVHEGQFIDVEPPQIVFDQVKEKIGTLRVYQHLEFYPAFIKWGELSEEARQVADRYSDYVDGVIHMAESMSTRTCEMTGLPGEMHVSHAARAGWYRTLNREYAKTDPFCVARGFVPVVDLSDDPIS